MESFLENDDDEDKKGSSSSSSSSSAAAAAAVDVAFKSSSSSSSSSSSKFQDVKVKDGVILIPPTIPRSIKISNNDNNTKSTNKNTGNNTSNSIKGSKFSKYTDYDDDDDYDIGDKRKSRLSGSIDPNDLTEQQKVERRERNREHAKRSRIRKKVLLDSLQDQLTELRQENLSLRRVVVDKLPTLASGILDKCTTEESMLLADDTPVSIKIPRSASGNELVQSAVILPRPVQHARILMEPDFRLIQALINSQQNFVLSDPSLPDNPIVYCSEGFIKLSGYKRQDIIGRNCRFLQGPGTDQAAVDVIRQGVAEGRDISVCLLNYRADGSPFWNQFFVAALRDADGAVVNFVGIQCEVNSIPVTEIKDRIKKLPIPDL
jgi:PAS domain S-box-containing protein